MWSFCAVKLLQQWLDDIWRWNEDEMSWINSLVLQGRGKCSYCAMRRCFELKMYVRNKKEKQNQIMWSTVSWATLSSAFDDRNRCLGPGYIVRKFSCPTFQMWNVCSTSNRAHSLLSLLSPIKPYPVKRTCDYQVQNQITQICFWVFDLQAVQSSPILLAGIRDSSSDHSRETTPMLQWY